MKIKISVTREIYRKTMWCTAMDITRSCAIALAVREIAPKARVGSHYVSWDGVCVPKNSTEHNQGNMITKFDETSPSDRPNLPEFSFEVDFPDSMVEQIGIEELTAILEKSETLEKV